MPAKHSKSDVMKKLQGMGKQLTQAHEAHKNDETEYSSFGDIPENINGGIAELIDCKIDITKEGKDNAGELYFYAAGMIHEPKNATTYDSKGKPNGEMRTEGKRTSITEPLYPTPDRKRATLDDHVAWIYNELRKLGASTAEIEPEDLPEVCASLIDDDADPIFFRFSTSKPPKQTKGKYAGKESRVFHNWEGTCEYDPDESDDEDDHIRDHGTKPSENGAAGKKKGKPGDEEEEETRKPGKKPAARKPAVEDEDEDEDEDEERDADADDSSPEFDEFGGIDDLVERADEKDDGDAQEELKSFALKAGYTQAEIKACADWAAVGELVKHPKEEEEEEQEAEKKPKEKPTHHGSKPGEQGAAAATAVIKQPKPGKIYKYSPPDPKKKGKTLPERECKVVSVNIVEKTAVLKDMDDLKLKYRDVPWDELS